ncbi:MULTISPECIES: FAD-dependent monooxygenase [Bradyrhizobium]|jgi:6-hydroxynicotinate 3-monooxygenase|uniref:FAD-dependent monooxygenase n=1 Tax=Bradyrhizobium TaxID=374 RepID=UPI0004840C7C|nr:MULTISPECIES: FAD-dependent monooxygenase [Bradyrhizobium]MCS3453580.1 salicylate hydroxylase/6-hydroxynicotinate 3-monooxygenase [Bradyrhizobium elkanii]MCS3564312.1 salicylate hydroxylase/6-hydroxynicotinate 3-monooxygenase [Bradyrhizobium elkanii]MCW2145856.1 salicylate hydroxylase/6-hydroxynicotinate 3-monooxygenase [Bradyrhizobium elkanii]MCW2355072.1 salicylate hydroxylase/6-hydroxynicotinate 3-monooxygenase [Bradyrhizobium elkanii]MCW2378683.1 salicylate hydroxylase/6-hydroxynicotina
MSRLSVAVIGAGMGGLASAAALTRAGIDVTVYEQAQRFTRLGAGIQIGCNAMKVMRAWDLEPLLRREAFYPRSWNNKEHDTGEVRFDMVFGPAAEERYGAPYLLGHRGDLHAALASAVPEKLVRLDHKLTAIEQRADRAVALTFANGHSTTVDAVVAADGVHSLVKERLFGRDEPNFTGRIAYRTVFPASLLNGYPIDDCTKWWGPDRHIVIYYVKPDRSEVYFVTSQPEPGFTVESWSATGDVNELRKAFEGFHPQVRKVLEACPSVHKWALVDRDPLPRWSEGSITLLGDACHPMTPYMAQGAAMAIEDAAVLSRCLKGVDRDGVSDAFRRFEATRKPRTSRVQASSRTNTWLKNPTDPDWVYGYDAWTAPLAEPALA